MIVEGESEATETVASDIAEAVTEVVTEVIQQEEREEIRAEEINRALIDTLIATERGKIIEELRGEIQSCLVRLADQEFRLSEAIANCSTLSSKVEAQEAAMAALVLASSIPPVSSPPPTPENMEEPAVVQAESLPPPEPEKPEPPKAPEKKKHRRLFL